MFTLAYVLPSLQITNFPCNGELCQSPNYYDGVQPSLKLTAKGLDRSNCIVAPSVLYEFSLLFHNAFNGALFCWQKDPRFAPILEGVFPDGIKNAIVLNVNPTIEAITSYFYGVCYHYFANISYRNSEKSVVESAFSLAFVPKNAKDDKFAPVAKIETDSGALVSPYNVSYIPNKKHNYKSCESLDKLYDILNKDVAITTTTFDLDVTK